jgi:hypothetical protein
LKELGFTSKTFVANFDELSLIVVSIKQHSCHLTIEEEQGIKRAAEYWQKGIIEMMAVEQKMAAKHWQKGIHLFLQPELFFGVLISRSFILV